MTTPRANRRAATHPHNGDLPYVSASQRWLAYRRMHALIHNLATVAALLLEEWLDALSEHWKLYFGIFLVLMVLFSPHGITGLLKKMGIVRGQQ